MQNKTKTQHTPGPWRNCQPDSNFKKGRQIIKPMDSSESIAEVMASRGVGFANARLIAAAPDILAALKSILDHVADTYPHDRDTHEAWLDAYAAIAKATGE